MARVHKALLNVLLLTSAFLGACASDRNPSPDESRSSVGRPTITEVLERHAAELMNHPGVQMVYEGRTAEGDPCIKVGVSEIDPAVRAAIPPVLEGWPVEIEQTGEIRPLHDD